MAESPTRSIKRSQKESLYLREITQLVHEITLDDPRIQGVFINRVELSADSGICTVYFYAPQGEEHFKEMLEFLKLYRPSMRRALADRVRSRYTPDLIFKFDTSFEKHQKLEELFEKIKDE